MIGDKKQVGGNATRTEKKKSSRASAQAKKVESASDISCSLFNTYTGAADQWKAFAKMELSGAAFSLNDFVMMDDVMGITWNSSIWAGQGVSAVDHGVDSSVSSTSQDNHTNDGATAAKISFKDGWFGDEDYSDQDIWMSTTLERRDQNPTESGVTFYYWHTGSESAFQSVNVSVSAGAISISTGSGKTLWKAFKDGKP